MDAKEAAEAARLAEMRDVLVPTAQLALADVVPAIVAGGGVVPGGKLEKCGDVQLTKDFEQANNSMKQIEKEQRLLAGVGSFRGRFPDIDTLVEQVAAGANVSKQTKADILNTANSVGLNKSEAEEFLAAVLAAAADCKVSCTASAEGLTAWVGDLTA
jgi:septal ring factor EnvC (AmiA/AmiB activator)